MVLDSLGPGPGLGTALPGLVRAPQARQTDTEARELSGSARSRLADPRSRESFHTWGKVISEIRKWLWVVVTETPSSFHSPPCWRETFHPGGSLHCSPAPPPACSDAPLGTPCPLPSSLFSPIGALGLSVKARGENCSRPPMARGEPRPLPLKLGVHCSLGRCEGDPTDSWKRGLGQHPRRACASPELEPLGHLPNLRF